MTDRKKDKSLSQYTKGFFLDEICLQMTCVAHRGITINQRNKMQQAPYSWKLEFLFNNKAYKFLFQDSLAYLSFLAKDACKELRVVLVVGLLVVEDETSLNLAPFHFTLQNLQVVHDVLDAEFLLNIQILN